MTDEPESTDPEQQTGTDPIPDSVPEAAIEAEVPAEPLETEAEDAGGEAADEEDEPQFDPKPGPPAKLERLQKILAQAGVASRRRAEELIAQGRVQVNGATVTELGTKADAGRDHIRVDGKLLQGAERLRYFVLNKPKGFVTTVKDPEGRPTVMKFFEKMRERLYPVGRLDYQSEGLLLVTNDGELANRLTKAASGVEKTYLVKVAGQPTEAELEILRGGVPIDRGQPGTERVRTAPARIRQVRQGDNPWYEVVLIEGRNRELRKMFEEIGHFVEKIRRVGYGPLVLDQEPGHLRELEPEELDALRKSAEGKYRTPKSKDVRRRNLADAGLLPTVRPKPSARPMQPADRFAPRPPAADRFGDAAPAKSSGPRASSPRASSPKREFGARAAGQGNARPFRPTRPPGEGFRPSAGGEAPSRSAPPRSAPPRSGSTRSPARPFTRPADRTPMDPTKDRPAARSADRPASRPPFKRDDRPARPPARFASGPDARPGRDRTGPARPAPGRPATGRSFPPKPAWKKPDSGSKPPYKRPLAPRIPAPEPPEDFSARKPSQLHIEPVERNDYADRPSRPAQSRSSSGRSGFSRPPSSRPTASRPTSGRPSFERPSAGRGDRPSRGDSGMARPFTTSSGKPRAGGARPSSKPGKPAFKPTGRIYGAGPKPGSGSGARPSRPYTPRPEGASSESRPGGAKRFSGPPTGRPFTGKPPAKSGSGWKPKPSFGAKPRPGGTARPPSRPQSKSGPRPGGKRPGPSRSKRP